MNTRRIKRVGVRTLIIAAALVAFAFTAGLVYAADGATISKPSNNKEVECGTAVTLEATAKWEKPEGGSDSDYNTITFRIEGNGDVFYEKERITRKILFTTQTITKSFIPNEEGKYHISVRQDMGDVDWKQIESEENPFIPDRNEIRTIKVWKSFTNTKVTVDVTGITDKEYTGEPIEQNPVVTVDGKQLVKDQDYTVSYSNNTNLGEAKVTITGQGFYKNSVTKTFQITPATITKNCVSGVVDLPFIRSSTRDRQHPVVVVNGRTLVKDTDYEVHFENTDQVGTATLIIAGIGYYTGEVRVPFKILPSPIRDATVTGIKDMAYTGEPVTLERRLSLKYKGYGIYENTDYTVTYKNNVKPGTATVIIKGKTNFTGTLTRTFNIIEAVEYQPTLSSYLITPKDNTEYAVGTTINVIAGAGFFEHRVPGEPYEFDKNYIYFRVTRSGEKVLCEYAPYTDTSTRVNLSFTPDKKGKYLIEVGRCNPLDAPIDYDSFNYFDSRTVYVGISSPTGPKDISTAAISGVTYKKYTGDSITQSPTVKLDGKTLVKGTDYYLTYTDNVEVGTATMTVRGQGKYTGTASKAFKILERKAYAKKALTDRVNAIEKAGVSNYTAADKKAVQKALDAAKKLLQNEDASAASMEKALTTLNNANKTAQTHLAELKAMPAASATQKAILAQKTDKDPSGSSFRILRLRSTKQGKTYNTLTWQKVSGATSYVIYASKCGNSNKIKKIATVKKNTYTHKKLKKKTYYKYVVVAVKSTVIGTRTVSISKMIHVSTKGSKYGNFKKVSVTKTVLTKAKKLKKGKSLKLGAKAVKASSKAKIHVKLRYQTSNKKVATVSSKGVVKGVGKGSCYVFVYAQNGVYKKIPVTVK